ncbi:MAG: DNA methyltransferase [candidate division KSB1 bacterium]
MFTNEEKRVSVYKKAAHPTIPQNVKSDTPLERLDLNWREADLPEKIRTKHVHRLHPYLGKFIPQLVEVFLRKYFVAGQIILDPFVGSGTALVQANEMGIHGIGHDVSAFNIMLCRAKTAHYDLQKVKNEVHDLIGKARARTQAEDSQLSFWGERREPLSSARLSVPDNEYLQAWFAPRALHELLAYRDLIDSEGYEYRDLLKIILCRSARSARLTTHFDLDFPKRPQVAPYWCYKHARECQPTTEAFKFLERYSVDSLKRIQEFSRIRTNAKTMIHHGDSRKTVVPPIDGVVTSPPYVGLIDYHEQHAYAYHLLKLDDKREQEIGPAAGGSSKAAQQKYQLDIAAVLGSAAQAMRRGGRMIVVAADKNELYGKIAELAGVEVEAVVQRHVNRRTGRRSSEFYESVFIWKKC